MSRATITDPLSYQDSILLRIIEQDPDSFTEGRRNNDIVNWFVICRIGEINEGTKLRPERYYLDDFEDLMQDTLSDDQVSDLDAWSEDYKTKLRRLHAHYGHCNIAQLRNIWLPMDYQVTPSVHELQAELPV